VVERRTWSADHPVTHVRFTYAAGSHALVARFTPSQS
jgi:GntR family histidine utilization transcriptional repressor